MGANSTIEWCDHTWNPWIGCTNVSPGCDHCYAETYGNRFGVNWGPGAPRRRTSASNWAKPIAWNALAAATGIRPRVFCASLADVFDNAVDPAWRADLAQLILATPHLDWLLLTKRIGNVLDMLIEMFPLGVPANVRIGATIVNQDEAARDLRKIEQVAVACIAKPFLSMEPLLGDVHLSAAHPRWMRFLGWIIAGGESGAGARPMSPYWIRTLRDQCAAAGVPFLFKQWGNCLPGAMDGEDENGGPAWVLDETVFGEDYWPEFGRGREVAAHGHNFIRFGKKPHCRLLDGVTHDGFPA